MAATTVRGHRLAAGYAIVIPSLALGLLLATRHPAFLAAGFGAALTCAGLARRYVQHWHAAEGRRTLGLGHEFGCLQPQFLTFHARRGGLPVVPMLALQLVPILLLAGYWITLSLGVLFAL